MKTVRVKAVADRLGKHPATIFRWIKLGLDINSENSIQQFSSGKKRRQHPKTIREPKGVSEVEVSEVEHFESAAPDLNHIELGPVGRRGAAAALARLEEIEERAHARLMQAIEIGNPLQVKACQEFYLRSSETLRRLDIAIQIERRKLGETVSKQLVESVSTQISEWLRLAFNQFLIAESESLMDLNDLGEFKAHAIDHFRGILHATVKARLKTDPQIPPWAAAQVIEAWNVPVF